MSTRAVIAPVADYSGTVAGVEFVDGAGVVDLDDIQAVAYFRRHGYRFERVDDDPPTSSTPEPPAKSANKPEWVAYAISQGADPDEAEAANKADLIDTYGDDA